MFIFSTCGAVAQLGECIPRTDEVTGSNPVCSILNSRQPFHVRLDEMYLKILRRDAGVG